MVKFGSQRIGSPRRTCQQRSESVFSAEPNEGFTLRPICAHDTAASSRYWRLCILRVSRKLLSSWIDVLVTNTAATNTCRNIAITLTDHSGQFSKSDIAWLHQPSR